MGGIKIIHSYRTYYNGIGGVLILSFLIYKFINTYFDNKPITFLIGIIVLIFIILILNKKMFKKYTITNESIVFYYPLNIFGLKKEQIEYNNISTLIYSPAGSRSASAIRISLKEGKKRYSLICSIKEKDKLKIHFKNFGLKLEDYYSSKVKLRKHIKY